MLPNARKSIQKTILCWTIAVIIFGGALSLLSAVYTTKHESTEVFDSTLIQAISLLDKLLPHEPNDYTAVLNKWVAEQSQIHTATLSDYLSKNLDDDDEEESLTYFSEGLAIIIQDQQGNLLFSSLPDHSVPKDLTVGFSKHVSNDEEWRVFSLFDEQRQLWFSSAQSMPLRKMLEMEISTSFISPLIIAGIILTLLVILIVKKSLVPLNILGRDLHLRDANDLTPIPEQGLPFELQSPVSSLNMLFQRVDTYIEREKRFTDNAAHELRTPLAAFKVNLDQDDPGRQSVIKMERLINQLLELARLNPKNESELNSTPFSLNDNITDVIAELYPIAVNRQMDIELKSETEAPQNMKGEPVLVSLLLRNLIENAIKYSIAGDNIVVTLTATDSGNSIQIVDHGKGLSDTQKEQVFERFYRADTSDSSGAGLGMTIVQNILDLHNGSIQLSDTPGGGLTVSLHFPI